MAHSTTTTHPDGETIGFGGLGAKLNWLRAAVLGANDGVVSGSGILLGVAAADHSNISAIMVAGVAGLLAGACAMAMGEYVSVFSQRDTEEALIVVERKVLQENPQAARDELLQSYRNQGLSDATTQIVVDELMSHNPLAALLRAKHGVHEEELTEPWHAAVASAVSFTTGFIFPLAAMYLGGEMRVPLTVCVGAVGLLLTGWISAVISGSGKTKPILRNVVGGLAAMVITYGVNQFFGVHGI